MATSDDCEIWVNFAHVSSALRPTEDALSLFLVVTKQSKSASFRKELFLAGYGHPACGEQGPNQPEQSYQLT